MKTFYENLGVYLQRKHNLILVESELQEIVDVVHGLFGRWERLTKSLVGSLKQFHAVSKGGIRNLNSCGFTFSQRANFQKLSYWKLAERVGSGDWMITDYGLRFLDGFADVPLQVFKVKGKAEIERVSVERVHIEDVLKKSEKFKAKFERIRLPMKQAELFI